MGLPYLDALARETLRLYAPITFLSRTTRKDVVLPLSSPIQSTTGDTISAIPIRSNTNVIIGIAAANRDREIWGDDADEWKPERWLGKGFSEVTRSGEKLPGVYSGMMTFLGGSRACIGFKFSELELKVVISTLIESLEFTPSKTKEIVWRNSSIQNPVTKDNVDGPSSLPLGVALAA
jgi:cytochrome P450